MTTECAIPRGHIAAHFAGTIDPSCEREMRAHLSACDPCRDRYERHLLLATLDPTAPSAEERLAIGLGLRGALGAKPEPRSWPRAVATAGAIVALAAGALLFVRPKVADEGFTARGGVASGTSASMPRVLVYRVPKGGAAVRALDTIARDDDLAFAYENETPGERLLVYGVDEHGHVFWFHPAWTSEAEDPAAIPIESDGQRHELPEAVGHRFDAERLTLHAVFTSRLVTVRQVEGAVQRREAPQSGDIDRILRLRISP